MPPSSRVLTLKECYDILGIDKTADLQTLKRAYRRKAFELHPDLNPGNPDSSRQFQRLNEAYVALSALLKPSDDATPGEKPGQNKKENTRGTGPEASEEKTKTFYSGQRREAHKAYAEQDVLRDLLNDPFARRVFEDIYSELNRQQAHARPEPEPEKEEPKRAARKEQPGKPDKSARQARRVINLQDDAGFGKGVTGAVKGWLRRQIDEEQSITLPAAGLRPGRRIRLQIRRGISDELETVEIILPADFSVGKPLRLKGLGKKVGPWVGDLYLSINRQ